jgi:hypothetical protein
MISHLQPFRERPFARLHPSSSRIIDALYPPLLPPSSLLVPLRMSRSSRSIGNRGRLSTLMGLYQSCRYPLRGEALVCTRPSMLSSFVCSPLTLDSRERQDMSIHYGFKRVSCLLQHLSLLLDGNSTQALIPSLHQDQTLALQSSMVTVLRTRLHVSSRPSTPLPIEMDQF